MDLSELNPQQQEAVLESMDNNTVLVAGAGSGKTRVVQVRTGFLIDDMNVSPEEIMVVTFTNKAIGELKQRLASVCPDMRGMWLGTFHSICVRALRKFGKSMGIENFTIMDTYDAKGSIRTVMESMGMPIEKATVNKFMAKISWCKSNLLNPTKMLSTASTSRDIEFARLYREYQDLTWRRRSFDFDDLIVYTVVMLTRCNDVRQWFWDNIKYVIIDESQDTNSTQFELVRLLAGSNNLFLVGDDYQSIYSWRNAKPEYLLNFQKYYPDAKVLYLEQNYRSTQTIVKASSAVIKHNLNQYDKNTFSAGPVGDPIIYHTGKDAKDEADWIATEILLLHSQGVKYKDTAILYRTNAQSRAMEESFMRFGLPYKMWGSLGFYDRKEVKDVISYLRVKSNPNDEVAFKRLLGLQKGFGKKTVDELCNYVLAVGCNCIEALGSFQCPKRLQAGVASLMNLFSLTPSCPSEFMESVLKDTGYMQDLIDEDTPEALIRIENLQELLSITKEHEDQEPGITLEEFINKLSLASDKGQDLNADTVNMMTIHSAKGLEYDIVFLVGAEEKILPHSNSIGMDSAIEEERRLFYVSMTRAKSQLYITNAASRRDYSNNINCNRASRFVDEIPSDYICKI